MIKNWYKRTSRSSPCICVCICTEVNENAQYTFGILQTYLTANRHANMVLSYQKSGLIGGRTIPYNNKRITEPNKLKLRLSLKKILVQQNKLSQTRLAFYCSLENGKIYLAMGKKYIMIRIILLFYNSASKHSFKNKRSAYRFKNI